MTSTKMAPVLGRLPAPEMTYGFFDAVRALPLPPGVEERWPMHGLMVEPRPVRGAYRTDSDCGPLDHTTDTPPACETSIEFLPFRIYDVMGYSTALSVMEEDYESRVVDRLRDLASYLFALELVDAAGSGSGFGLSQTATAPTTPAFGAGALELGLGVAMLENELSRRLRGRQGMIFVGPGLFTQIVDECDLRFDGTRWVTPLGNVVVTDSAWADIAQPSGQAAPGATEDWIYGSSEVFYASTTPELLGNRSDSFLQRQRHNDIRRFAEGYGLLAFETQTVTAVKVNYDAA
jgi:hypothetical protein